MKRTMVFLSLMTSPRRSIVRSISSIVLPSPSEKRRAQCASSSESPIASKACEGLGEPALHADPEERETPFWSRARTTDSPRIPGKVIFNVPGYPLYSCGFYKRLILLRSRHHSPLHKSIKYFPDISAFPSVLRILLHDECQATNVSIMLH